EAKLLANSLKRSSFCTSLRYGAFTFRGPLTHSYARFPRVSEIHSDKWRAFSPMELPEQLQVSCGRPESASSISWGRCINNRTQATHSTTQRERRLIE